MWKASRQRVSQREESWSCEKAQRRNYEQGNCQFLFDSTSPRKTRLFVLSVEVNWMAPKKHLTDICLCDGNLK